MNDERFGQLLDSYINGTASVPEQLELQRWYESRNNKEVIWQANAADEEEVLRERLFSNISKRTLALKSKQQKLWRRIGAAAAVVLVIGAGLIFYKNNRSTAENEIAYANDIAPGTSSATLTLSDGKKILLSSAANGELAREAGVSIVKTASGQLVYEASSSPSRSNKINTLSTANGETYQLRLPDGTAVWLNAASSISFPASFASLSTRNVKTTGEVYFEVAKDKLHPFVLETKGQRLEVLGTHFNINSYANEDQIRTTLLEGSVKVRGATGREGILRPGQQSMVSGSGELKISEADTELATAWKNNEFRFEHEPIENIMKMVERWYNVEVIYTGEKPTEAFIGGVSRFDRVSKVLHILESTGSVHFRVEGRRIYVSK